MKYSLIIISIFFNLLGSSKVQAQDTLFYNHAWKACTKDSAAFVRIVKLKNNSFLVNDYFYPAYQLQMTGSYSEIGSDREIENGSFVYYADAEYKTSSGNFIYGKKEGIWTYFNADGSILSTKTYHGDKLNGDCIGYNKQGKHRKEIFENDKFISGICYTSKGKDTTYYPAEEMPEFKGGYEALTAYIHKNLKYPSIAREQKIEGKVMVGFVVKEDGLLEKVEIISSPHFSLSTEAMRLMFAMPAWKPGRVEGVPVKVKFTLPIRFSL